MIYLVYFYIFLGAVCAALLYRNSQVCTTRIAIINAGGLWDGSYEALPSYDAMLLLPKYWLLWNEPHWRAWLARNPVVA